MTSSQLGIPLDPELVLAGVKALRWRMEKVMGAEWAPFGRKLDRLYERAVAATGDERERVVAEILRFGLDSPVAEIFEAIEAHATSAAAMKELTEFQKKLEARESRESTQREETVGGIAEEERRGYRRQRQQQQEQDEAEQEQLDGYDDSLRSARPDERTPTHAMRPYEEAAVGHEAAAREPESEPQEMAFPKEIDHAEAASRPRSANGGSRRKGKRSVTRKAKRRAVPKAKRATPRKAKHPPLKRNGAHRTRAAAPLRAVATRPVKPTREPRRFVNLYFASLNERAIPRTKPLVARREYRLRVGIGDLVRKSVVANAAANPVRADLLPKNPEGHWLQLAAVSKTFRVSPLGRWLFLPTDGAAWACRCKPGGAHRCNARSRRDAVEFPVRAPSATGPATLRLTIYYQKSILQSLLVTAVITRASAGRGFNRAVVDYNLTDSLADVELVRPRALSVMMNDADDGSHTMVFNGAPKEVATVHLNDDQMTSALGVMREVMRNIHIEVRGPRDVDKINRYDTQNRKSRDDFIADLKQLAERGYELWTALWYEKTEDWIKNHKLFVEDSDVVHIGRKSKSTSAFPWAMVYDLPIEIGAPENYHLCELLDKTNWEKFQSASGDVPTRCPYESNHGENVICPYGFWGIRYEIEQPPSLQKGRSLPRTIPVDPPPLNFVVALSDNLDAQLLATHMTTLRTQTQGFQLLPYRTRNDIRKGLGISAIEVVYFYCHGYTNPLPGNAGSRPSLGVGNKQVIAPTDLTVWRRKWSNDHWQTTAPLVFINGCHTADTTPQTLVNFVDIFSATLHASGVIGTEITVHQLVANEVGETFLKEFQLGHSVGKSLRQARGSLLRKGNLLGLVYTAYCSADLQLAAGVP